ncbi:putative peptidase domain-containing protein [Chaetomium strumarium]|uniref:Peptidase domain-containing protein n=1 Tax=Chaetomium strumarium TaxID=1170767 RepID=A0AAJ0GT67_9PEZI|nr:putative peptidase domain-containing protein [Chaetomium strumarium]
MQLKFLSVLCLFGVSTWALPAPAEQTTATSTSGTSTSSASPTPWDFRRGAVTEYPVHSSCNSTLRRQLERALNETVELATHARDHILRWGGDSPFVQKYFGNGTATATPLGWYERVIAADRRNMTFRCDDPDRNCATQDGWAGHWRGANATQETVICDLSFAKRRWLDSVCGLGYTVTESPLNTFWATDLLHRVLHVPRISENVVEHFAEDYEGVVELAKTDPAKSAIDSDTLQYFAIDVYAFDIAAPGVGCTGN